MLSLLNGQDVDPITRPGSKRARTDASSSSEAQSAGVNAEIKAEVAAIKDTESAIMSNQHHLSKQVTSIKDAQQHASNQVQRLVNHKTKFYTRLQDLPLEIVDLIFSWIPVWAVFKYRRLSRSINERLLTAQFAVLNMRRHHKVSFVKIWLHLPQEYQAEAARDLGGWLKNFVSMNMGPSKTRLPKSIGCLTAVETIDLLRCKLIGTIPDEIGALKNLAILELRQNALTGALPRSFALLTGLKMLDLSENQLSGDFPPLPNTNLERIVLSRNRFTGPIPTVFGDPCKLRRLRADGNRFTAIPASIGQLTNLKELCISRNSFSSEIPSELWNLQTLKTLEMSGCSMFGTLAGIGSLINLEILDLSNNQFSGDAPSQEIYQLQRLLALHLIRNQLTGCEGGLLDMSRMPFQVSMCMDREFPRHQVHGYLRCKFHTDQDNGDTSDSETDPDSEPGSELE
ncbi:hypothetical protein CcCBS67573_g03402 [Chytriomyces confervae]|uniref:F-box domain-containing protein n=1 Tax=Chytriomyces confervae TaxID=246404 RepID=A0A507FG63_9FUNG|nr:hypothetical protein CcCBS67573_g03402 [Chytriomyces confervae]